MHRLRVPGRKERLQPPNLLDFELWIGPLHGNIGIAFRVGVDADNRALALFELHLEPVSGIRDLPLDPTRFDAFAYPATGVHVTDELRRVGLEVVRVRVDRVRSLTCIA